MMTSLKKNIQLKFIYNNLIARNKKGIIAIEFSLIIIPFLSLFLLTAEICRMLYVASVINLSLAESSRYAANNKEISYKVAFIANLKKNLSNIPLIANNNQISFNVSYCQSIESIIVENCTENNENNMPLAIYRITYHYKPIFFILPNNYTEKMISKSLVYVQEYERNNY